MPDPLFAIEGKSIVIAGAASGLGGTLAARGAHLTIADICGDGLATLAGELGGAAASRTADITREGDADALMMHAVERFGRVDGVVNTAGVLRIASALDLPAAHFARRST
jgi:3alpha(or 20beta)-hydroxysteroid dehydrogenase